MSSLVEITVSFSMTENGPLAALAAEHLAFLKSLPEDDQPPAEAFLFLDELSKRTGFNRGTKGGMVAWGAVGNYLMPETFIEALDNFWVDLFNEKAGRSFSHWTSILVISQAEGAWARVFEIGLDRTKPDKRAGERRPVVVPHDQLKFGWRRGDL